MNIITKDFIWKSIVINMWTDFNIDRNDKFILNNQTKVTDITADILSAEEVSSNFTLKNCKEIYWSNVEETGDDKCTCKTGYKWNENKTACEVVEVLNTCIDAINWYKWTDWKCYCNYWYIWSDIENKCIVNNNYTCGTNATLNEPWKYVCNEGYLFGKMKMILKIQTV